MIAMVEIDRVTVDYLLPVDEVPLDPRPWGFDTFDDRTLRGHTRVRRALYRFRPTAVPLFGYLHWSDGTDLDELDRRIVSRMHSPQDFAGAVWVEGRSVTCRSCGSSLRLLLPDSGHPLGSAARQQRHTFGSVCPVCSEPLGLQVAEVLSQVGPHQDPCGPNGKAVEEST